MIVSEIAGRSGNSGGISQTQLIAALAMSARMAEIGHKRSFWPGQDPSNPVICPAARPQLLPVRREHMRPRRNYFRCAGSTQRKQGPAH